MERDQVIGPKIEVRPMSSLAATDDQPDVAPDAVGLVMTGRGVSDRTERQRTYVMKLEEAEHVASRLHAAVQMIRAQRAGE